MLYISQAFGAPIFSGLPKLIRNKTIIENDQGDILKKTSTVLSMYVSDPKNLAQIISTKIEGYYSPVTRGYIEKQTEVLNALQGRIWIPALLKLPPNAYKVNVFYNQPISDENIKKFNEDLETIFKQILEDYFVKMVLESGLYIKSTPSPAKSTHLGTFFEQQMQVAVKRLKDFMDAPTEAKRNEIASETFAHKRKPSQEVRLSPLDLGLPEAEQVSETKTFADTFTELGKTLERLKQALSNLAPRL